MIINNRILISLLLRILLAFLASPHCPLKPVELADSLYFENLDPIE